MSVMSVRVDDEKRKQLKAIASLQGKTMSSILEELIDMYIDSFKYDDELMSILKASEPSFNEWDNDEDSVYDNL
jgi:hypothetical protein